MTGFHFFKINSTVVTLNSTGLNNSTNVHNAPIAYTSHKMKTPVSRLSLSISETKFGCVFTSGTILVAPDLI